MTLRYVHMCDSQHSLEQQFIANVTVRDVGPARARSYWAQPVTPPINTSALVGTYVECFVDRYRNVFFEFDLDALLDVCLAIVSLMQCFLAATCSAWLFMPENKASVDLRLDGSLPHVNIDRKVLRASLIEQALGHVARDVPEREQKCVKFVDLLLATRLQHIEYSVTYRASRWFESIGETFTHHKLRFRLQRPSADETPAELEPFAQSLEQQALVYELCGAAAPQGGSRLQHRLSLGAWKVGSARAAKQAAPVHLRDGDEDPQFSFTDGRWSFSSLAVAVENATHRADMQVPYRWATEDESSLNCQVCVQRMFDHLQLQSMQLLSSSDHMLALRSTAATSPVSGHVQRGRFARTGLVCLLFELAFVLLPLYGTTLYYFGPKLDDAHVEHALLIALLYVLGGVLIFAPLRRATRLVRKGTGRDCTCAGSQSVGPPSNGACQALTDRAVSNTVASSVHARSWLQVVPRRGQASAGRRFPETSNKCSLGVDTCADGAMPVSAWICDEGDHTTCEERCCAGTCRANPAVGKASNPIDLSPNKSCGVHSHPQLTLTHTHSLNHSRSFRHTSHSHH
jgi:hypothetical protein